MAIPAASEDAHRAFWCEILGFVELEKPEALKPRGGAWYSGGDCEIHLGVEQDFSPAKKAHPAFRTLEIDDLAEKLATAGFSVRWDSKINGRRRFFTDDPAGNRIEFIGDK